MEKLNIKVEGGGTETELVTLSVQRKNWESRNYLFVGSSSLAYNDELNNNITNLQSQIASSSSTYTTDYIDMDSCSKEVDNHQIIIEERTIKLANGQEQKIRIPYIMAKREQDLCIGIAMKVYGNDWYWSSDINNKYSSYHNHSD